MRVLVLDFHFDGRSGEFRGSFTPSTGVRISHGFTALGWEVEPWDPVLKPHREPTGPWDLVYLHGQKLRVWRDGPWWIDRHVDRETPVVVNYCDMRPEIEPWLEIMCERTDLLTHAAGGEWLLRFRDLGFRRVVFAPGPVLPYKRTVEGRDIEWYFSGSRSMTLGDGCRLEDIEYACQALGKRIFAAGFREPSSGGWRHIEQCHRARKGIAVSHFHEMPKYTSQRTAHYMMAGIDIIARRFEGCEAMLPRAVPLYRNERSLGRLLREHRRSEDRVAILRSWAQRHYHAREVVAAMLDYLDGNPPAQPWAEAFDA